MRERVRRSRDVRRLDGGLGISTARSGPGKLTVLSESLLLKLWRLVTGGRDDMPVGEEESAGTDAEAVIKVGRPRVVGGGRDWCDVETGLMGAVVYCLSEASDVRRLWLG